MRHYAVIMAGGSGQRLWPLSRKNKPKQIIEAFEGRSLLHLCVDRIRGVFEPDHILIVTNQEYADTVHEYIPELPMENILGEPEGRDTANAIGLAATVLYKRDPDSVMAVFSADQIIEPVEPLQEAVKKSFEFLEDHPRALFTFGIKASHAHTGFGYLKRGQEVDRSLPGIYPVEAFKEKPNKITARKYIRSGKYSWNSGMFIWRVDTILDQIGRFLPQNAAILKKIGQAWGTDKQREVLHQKFGSLEKISIDYGVMERAVEVYMCALDCRWQDVGSYQALSDTLGERDESGNITTQRGDVLWVDSMNNIAISETDGHLIAAIHVEDMIIVHTEDVTLICHRDETSHLKNLVENMQNSKLEKFL